MVDGEFAWLELPGGEDCRATGRFYATVFGWLVDDDGTTVRFREPSGRLGGAFRGDLPAAASGPVLYLAATDAATLLGHIRAAGGQIVLERTLIAPGVGWRAMFVDPAGSTLGLFERGA
jgi:predicted enzyme related to lactoylglutathione lyase